MALLYNLTNSSEFINIDGIAGTSAAGISYSLRKDNIIKFSKDTAATLTITMVDDVVYYLNYNEIKDPATGVAYVSLDAFEVSMEGFANSSSSAAASGGVGGGNNTYSNINNTDFTATPTVGAKTITIAGGPPFILEAQNVIAGRITKISTDGTITPLSPTKVTVVGGVITLTGVDSFVAGDKVIVILAGPDKGFSTELNNMLVSVQNPPYAHTTSVETLVDETNILGYKAVGDAGGNTTTVVKSDGAFSEANIAVGYTAYQTADAQSAKVSSVDSATNITTSVLSGAATWASKAYSLPQVKRYEINADTYNFLSIHYRLRCLTFSNAYFKIYGTLDAAATVDSDTGWVNLSAPLLGNADGIIVPTSLTEIKEDIITIDTATTMLKYMIKLVVESNSSSPNTNSFKVFVKKSS